LSKNFTLKLFILCFAAGRISSPHKFSNLIACGDYVSFTIDDSSSNEQSGLIFQVEERKTKLSRRDPANPNREHVISSNNSHLLIFMSIDEPLINLRLIDRILVAAELGQIRTHHLHKQN
jgi:putative ribosome biogenesis GTPase RsgA